MTLRQVADLGVAASGRLRRARSPCRRSAAGGRAAHGGASTCRRRSARARRRARPVRSSGRRRSRSCRPPISAAAPRSSTAGVLGHRPVARWSAAISRLELGRLPLLEVRAFAGESVSVTVATGMCSARASALACSTSGVTFWLLNTQTLTWWRRSCRSTVALSFDADLGALRDCLCEARRRQQSQTEARRRAARRCSRCSRRARRHSGGGSRAQRVVARESLASRTRASGPRSSARRRGPPGCRRR